MKQKKYVFFTYAFKKDPDSTPDKRVDEDKIQSLFGDIFAAGEKLEIYGAPDKPCGVLCRC